MYEQWGTGQRYLFSGSFSVPAASMQHSCRSGPSSAFSVHSVTGIEIAWAYAMDAFVDKARAGLGSVTGCDWTL